MVLITWVEKWRSKGLQIILKLVLGFLKPNLGIKCIWVSSSLLLPLMQKGKPRQALGKTNTHSIEPEKYLARQWTFLARSFAGFQTLKRGQKLLFLGRYLDSSGKQRLTEFWTMRAVPPHPPFSTNEISELVLAKGETMRSGRRFSQQWPPVPKQWAALTAQGDVQLEIFERILIPSGDPRRGSRVRGHVCSLKG